MNDLMTIKEIADLQGVSEKTVRRWIAESELNPDAISADSRHEMSFSRARLDVLMSKRELQLPTYTLETSKRNDLKVDKQALGADKLVSVAEIAEKEGVSEKTVRYWMAEMVFEPEELRINPQGSRTPLYSWTKWELQLPIYREQKVIEKLSDSGKLKFMIGHIELEGTEEQVAAIRGYIDGLRLQLENKNEELKMITDSRDHYEEMALSNAREYNRILKYVPEHLKTKQQRDWENAPSASSLIAWMDRKR
jgi:predicted transcriptional regulator